MKIINGLKDVADNYEVFIIDLWGVIHDGTNLYPMAIEAIKHLQNKKIIFLSNGPFRAERAESTLARLGIGKQHYLTIITSGEVVYQQLADKSVAGINYNNKRYVYIGPERNIDLLNGLDYQITQDFNNASFVLVTGFYNDDYDIVKAGIYLKQALTYNLPLICANPDQIVVKQTGETLLCAGVIAKEYERIGGSVIYYGKPYITVYEEIFKYIKINNENILAVGDSLETDIKGANMAKIDSLLIAGGILRNKIIINEHIDINLISTLCDQEHAIPTYINKFFSW
jgi:HAD superfamily hydrolase (TIGR01459 family)